MDDLEAQLRRYADHVEDQVGQIPPFGATRRPTSSRRWPIYAAAAFLVVVGMGVATWLTADDESGDPADDADVIIGEEDEPSPSPLDSNSIDSESPLSPRRDPMIAAGGDHVVVWSGFDADGNLLWDGGVYDRVDDTWRTITLPVGAKATSVGVVVREQQAAYIAHGVDLVRLDLADGSSERLVDPPFTPVELTYTPDLLIAVNGAEVATLPLDGEGGWTRWSAYDLFSEAEIPADFAHGYWSGHDGRIVGAVFASNGPVVVSYDPVTGSGERVAGPLPGFDAEPSVAVLGGGPSESQVLSIASSAGFVMSVEDTGAYQISRFASDLEPERFFGIEFSYGSETERFAVRVGDGPIHLSDDEGSFVRPPRYGADLLPFFDDAWGPAVGWFGAPDGEGFGSHLRVESIEAATADLPMAVGNVVLADSLDFGVPEWNVTSTGERLNVSVDVEHECLVDVHWSAAVETIDVVGQAFELSDGLYVFRCTDPDVRDRLIAGAVHIIDGPVAAVAPADPVEPELVVLPGVTSLYADTAIQTLRIAGVEVATVFEEVPAGSPSVGRVIAQAPAPFEEVEAGSIVTITVGESAPEEWQPISDEEAYRVVDGFLAALAAEDWEIAGHYMDNGAADPQALLDIGLVEGQGDWGPLLADYCAAALCGADHEIVGIERNEFSVVVQVEMSSADGPVIAPFGMGWFEGIVSVDALPPEGEVGDPLPTTLERLFGEVTPAGEVVVARTTSIEWSEGSHPTRTLFWTGRTGGIAAVAGGEVVFGGGLTSVLDDGFGRQVSTAVFAGASDADGRPVVFGYDEELLGLVAYDVAGVEDPSTVVIDGDAERRSYSASVGDRFIAITVGFGHSGWIEISERDGYAAMSNTTRRLDLEDFSIGGALLAPDDSSLVLFTAPDFPTPFDAIEQYSLDGDRLGGWSVPEGEAFSGALDFDGRWVVAGLVSGRVFVIDTATDAARLTDVYAQVFFD